MGIWDSDHDEGHRRSRGKRSDPSRRGRSSSHGSRRNPLLVPDGADDASSDSHGSRETPLAPIVEELAEAGRSERTSRRRHKQHGSPAEKSVATKRAPVGLTHMMFLLVGLALGAALLLSMNRLYTLLGERKTEEPQPVATIPNPPAPPPAAAPRVTQRATEPTQAIKLMLSAAARGDVDTAYAQWDIAPDDLATVKRGQEMTLSDVVAKAKDSPAPIGNLQLRVISRSEAEARVGEFRSGLCLQVFSLRKQGSYWKLYNASAP